MKNMFTEKSKAKQVTTESATQRANEYAVQKAGDESAQIAEYGAEQVAGNYSSQIAGARSTQTAGECANQMAGSDSIQIAGHRSIQTAGDNTKQTAGAETMQIGWWFDIDYHITARIVTLKEANKPYMFNKGIWTEVAKEIFSEKKTNTNCVQNKTITIDGQKYKLTKIE